MTRPLPSPLCSSFNQGPTLWTHETEAGAWWFGVYVTGTTGAYTVRVCKIDKATGATSTFDLATVPGNPLSLPLDNSDQHETPSICVDAEGYVHVAANNWTEPKPARIVRGTVAGAITSWEADTWDGPQYDTTTYVHYAPFSDGAVLGVYRQRILGVDPDNPAVTTVEIIDAGETDWRFVCELTEGASGSEDSFYYAHPHIDPDDNIHIFGWWDRAYGAGVFPDITVHHHSYMTSSDRGATWTTIDGTPLTLPISRTNAAGVACRTGIDYGDPETTNEYAHGCSLDADGYPCCNTIDRTSSVCHLVRWDGDSWVDETYAPPSYFGGPSAHMLTLFRGDLWATARLNGTNRARMRRVASPNETIDFATNIPAGWTVHVDPVARARYGTIDTLVLHDGITPSVVSVGNNPRMTAGA